MSSSGVRTRKKGAKTADERTGSLQDLILARVGTHTTTYKRTVAAARNAAYKFNPDDPQAYVRWVEEEGKRVYPTSQKTAELECLSYISNMWHTSVQRNSPEVTANEMFRYDIVENSITKFITHAITVVKPLRGHSVIKASTLAGLMYNMLNLICERTFGLTNRKRGYGLLSRGGFYSRLQQQFRYALQTPLVDNIGYNSTFSGREQVHAAASKALINTEDCPAARACVLQTIGWMLIIFASTCQSSTDAHVKRSLEEGGQYLTLRFVRIFRVAHMDYKITINLLNFKTITLRTVLYAHNILFDPVIPLLSLFLVRGFYKQKYSGSEDLFADESDEILLDPSKMEEPLFLEPQADWKGFTQHPQSFESATRSVMQLFAQAGRSLLEITFLMLLLNYYGQKLGLEIAKNLMAGVDGSSSVKMRSLNENPIEYMIQCIHEKKFDDASSSKAFKAPSRRGAFKFQGTSHEEIEQAEHNWYNEDNGIACRYSGDAASWAKNLDRTLRIEENMAAQERVITPTINKLVQAYGPIDGTTTGVNQQTTFDPPCVQEVIETDILGLEITHVRRQMFDYYTKPFVGFDEVLPGLPFEVHNDVENASIIDGPSLNGASEIARMCAWYRTTRAADETRDYLAHSGWDVTEDLGFDVEAIRKRLREERTDKAIASHPPDYEIKNLDFDSFVSKRFDGEYEIVHARVST